MAPAETSGWNRKPDADGKVRPAVVIISRGLPGICAFLVCSIRELHTGFVLSSPTPREGRHAVSDFRRRFGGQHQIGVNFGYPRQPVGPEPETTADQERERDVRRARVDLVGEAGSRKEVIRWMCIRS